MSAPYQAASSAPSHGLVETAAFWVTVVVVVAATLAAALLGSPVLAVAPVAIVASVVAMARLPLRSTSCVLLVLLLGVDDHADEVGQWRTPLAYLGDVMGGRLDAVLGIPGLAVTGMEVLVVLLLILFVWRRTTGSTIDSEGQVSVPPAVRDLIVLYLLAVLFSEGIGLTRGLTLAPWKLRNLLHPILLAILFLYAFRPRDVKLVGWVVVACACMRAIEVIIVQRIAIAATGGHMESGTSHGDSIPFAVAIVLLVVSALERPIKRHLIRAVLLLPILIAGALENERRLVWVMVSISLLVLFILVPMKGWKLVVTKVILVVLPAVAVYVGAGWNSSSSFFSPVRTLRSVADTSVDHSAYWREVEDWNIATSMRNNPLFGAGLGGKYSEQMFNDDITSGYKEYKEWPHNSVLGLLFLMGLIPFTAMWLLFPAAAFLAMRTYRLAKDPDHRIAALGCVAAVVACLAQGYGDLGAHFPQFKVYAALAIALAARLAVESGAYPGGRSAREEG